MATIRALIAAMETLASAYPEAKREKSTLKIYQRYLADIPDDWLKRAVDMHICTSKWYPLVAELRQHVAHLAGTNDFDSLYDFSPQEIREQFIALENAFYHEGRLVELDWLDLAKMADENNCPHQAENIRNRLRLHQELLKKREADQEAPALKPDPSHLNPHPPEAHRLEPPRSLPNRNE